MGSRWISVSRPVARSTAKNPDQPWIDRAGEDQATFGGHGQGHALRTDPVVG